MQLNHQMTHNRGDILHNKAFSTQASSDDTLWQFSVIKYPFQWKLLSWWYPVSQKRMNVPKRKIDVFLELSYSNFLCESRRLNQLMIDKILLCMGNFLAGVVYFELNAYANKVVAFSRGKFVSKLDEIFWCPPLARWWLLLYHWTVCQLMHNWSRLPSNNHFFWNPIWERELQSLFWRITLPCKKCCLRRIAHERI